jgi:HAD superfamily hydrolase (TIGR01509 family)
LDDGKILLKKYDLFIFDWDGTLSEMHSVLKANEWIKRKLRTWDRAARIKEMESRRKEVLRREIRIEETKNVFLATVFEVLAIFYRPRLHRDTTELLALLKRMGKNVAILSNGNSSRLSKELERMGIGKYFDLVVSAKDIGAVKPDPRGIKVIVARMKTRPSRTLFLGDMIDDILTADLAGVDSCAVSDGFDSHEKLKSAGPRYIFRSVEEMFAQMGSCAPKKQNNKHIYTCIEK